MPYEFIPVVIGVIFIFGLIFAGLVRKSLADKERLQLREMIHRERMTAMEKGMQIDPLKLEDVTMPEMPVSSSRGDAVTWMRFTALFLGLAFFFGGFGIALAFHIASDRGMNEMWSIGLIPALTGLGLLIFYFMTVGYEKSNRAG